MQTQPQIPLAPPVGAPSVSPYCDELYPIGTAQKLVRMSRTMFYSWRPANKIFTIRGNRLHGAAIVGALERERGRPDSGPMMPLWEYSNKLLTIEEAAAAFRFSVTTLFQLRAAHKLPLLSGSTLHHDDIVEAMEAERRGESLHGRAGTVRVVLRRVKRRQSPSPHDSTQSATT